VVLALHTAGSVADYVTLLKYAFGPTSLASIVALLWFVASYTGQRPRRFLLFELRPAALLAADLGTLLRQLGDVLTGNSRVPVALTIEGEAQLPADTKIVVYRIAQEAFNNIAKHAGATQVWVTLRAAPGQLFLSVRDDGRGFDSSSVAMDDGLVSSIVHRLSSDQYTFMALPRLPPHRPSHMV